MANVSSAASKVKSPVVSSANHMAFPAKNLAGATDEATAWLSDAPQHSYPGASAKRLYPSTETFGEPAGCSSPREPESDFALPLSTRETVEVSRFGPRMISAASCVLAATRSLESPCRLSPSSDDEQWMLPALDRGEGGRPTTRIPSRKASLEANDLSDVHRLSGEPSPPRLSGLACGLLVAGAVLWLVSALLALVAWRLDSEPLGADLVYNVSSLVHRQEGLVSAGGEGQMGAEGEDFANGSTVARNLSTVTAHPPAQPPKVGLVLGPPF
ncbi:uncharacterized protein LOC144119134 [Amblyomma americanum]